MTDETMDGQRLEELKGKIAALDKETVFQMLAAIRRERGYRHGWISVTFREIFGHWPEFKISTKKIEIVGPVEDFISLKLRRYHTQREDETSRYCAELRARARAEKAVSEPESNVIPFKR